MSSTTQIRVVKYRKLEKGRHQTEYLICNVTFDADMKPVVAFPVITGADAIRDLKTLVVELWGATQTPVIEYGEVVDMDNLKKSAFPLQWKSKSSRSKKQPTAH